MKRSKEVNPIVFSNCLNAGHYSGYLSDDDMYIYKKEQPKHKINVIGCGMIGQEHMRVTMLEGRAEVYGIYDVDQRSIAQAKDMFAALYPEATLKVYEDLDSACNDPEVDGLIICTPNFSHMSVVREAAKSGKHILMEKPMVTKLEDAFEMLELAKDYPATFQVGLQYRYKPIYVEARKEALERKSIGEIKSIAIMEHRIPFLDKVNQWNKFSEYSGGTLVEKCCHYFDLFNLFAQSKPKSVYAVGGQDVNFVGFEKNGKKSDILDNAIVTVVYENGIKANFNLCMFVPQYYEELTLCGDEGRIRAYEDENYLPEQGHGAHFEMLCGDRRPSLITTPCYPRTIHTSGHAGGSYYAHKTFIDNMEGLETDSATVEEGFWSVIIGMAAEESVRTGKVVLIEELLASVRK